MLTLVIAAVLIALDQLTKYLATTFLAPVGSVPFLPGIMELRYVLNDGMAFSMLAGKRWILVAATGIALCAIAVYLWRKKPATKAEYLEYWSWVLVFAGGVGNLIDRVRTGYVVDFFATTFIDFAVFNVADCFVTVGIALLIISVILLERGSSQKTRETDGSDGANV